jgi:hypothetical protein
MKKINSLQDWILIDKILNQGIVKLKNNFYIKILKIDPVNYNLKSDLEKEAILNSYKIFLKSCNFDIQILIQSKKEDLSKNILKIKENYLKEDFIKEYSEEYIKYITTLNNEKKSSSKNFFIIIKNSKIDLELKNSEDVIIQELNEKYFKIKEGLSRCGNIVSEINYEEIEKILFSFLNSRKFLKN